MEGKEMRKWKSAISCGLLALLLLTGCEPQGSSVKHRAPEAPAPTKAVQAQPPAPQANQPGPQADPGQCNERGNRMVELQAHWTSETDRPPSVNWTLNGESFPARGIHSGRDRPGMMYTGEWSTLVPVKCKDILSVNIKGTPSTRTVICVIIDLGQDITKTGNRDCAATYVVP